MCSIKVCYEDLLTLIEFFITVIELESDLEFFRVLSDEDMVSIAILLFVQDFLRGFLQIKVAHCLKYFVYRL